MRVCCNFTQSNPLYPTQMLFCVCYQMILFLLVSDLYNEQDGRAQSDVQYQKGCARERTAGTNYDIGNTGLICFENNMH